MTEPDPVPRPFWARLASTLGHPLLMPVVLLSGLFLSVPGLDHFPGAFFYLLLLLVVNTLAPSISLFMLYRRGVISDLEIRSPKERVLPFGLVGAYFVLTYAWVHWGAAGAEIPLPYHRMLLGLSGAILLGVLITPRFKISMHMLALGGVWGAWLGSGGLDRAGRLAQGLLHFGWEVVELHRGLFWREMALLTLPVLAAGWVGSARVALGVHRSVEVYVGWGLGALWMALIMAFNLN